MIRIVFQPISRIAPRRVARVHHLSDFQTHAGRRTLTLMFKLDVYC